MVKKKSKQAVQQQPPESGNFWTLNNQRAFHEAVAELKAKADVPDGVSQGYRHLARIDDEQYVLSSDEEIELADHIAFLFPTEERSETITAVTIEQHDRGRKLVFRLASNETPKRAVITEFEEVIGEVRRYAKDGGGRRVACEALFEKVLKVRSTRILQRLQTPNGGTPPFRRGSIQPLHGRLREKLKLVKSCQLYKEWPRDRRGKFDSLFSEVERLCEVYKAVDTTHDPVDLKAALRTAVEKSSPLSTRDEEKYTLAQQLSALDLGPEHCENKEVLQVDKIGRYYSLCPYILHLARHHQQLFSNIEIHICRKYNETFMPFGSRFACHVHGEVKLAMHYEHHPHHPPPRAIGSSKSMCFLCGLFLNTQARYRASHHHKRLYDKWTIPDVNWMDEEQVLRFQLIVKAMTQELVMLKQRPRGGSIPYPVESRCHLPFEYPSSSPSAASSTATIKSLPSPPRSLTPTQADYGPIVAPISQSDEQLQSAVDDVFVEQARRFSLTKEHPPPQDAVPTPPASLRIVSSSATPRTSPRASPRASPPLPPIITSRTRTTRAPSPPALISRTPSHLKLFSTSIPLSHMFSFHGPDVEITISETPFIFEFASVATGTLSISWHDMADSREPFSPDVAAGLHGSLEMQPCHHIDLATLGEEAVCRKRNGGRSCHFTIRVDDMTAVNIGIIWDEDN